MNALAKTAIGTVLKIEGLSIKLPQGADRELAVENVDLELRAGQTLCVVGESGSGKSLIAGAVMGLLPKPRIAPVAGRILFEGEDLLNLSEARMRRLRSQRIGMIFQEPMTSLNPVMKIGEQIGEVLYAHLSLSSTERRTRNVGFTLRRGETLGIVGESGSGKSIVGRCLTGLVPADSGLIRFDGQALALDLHNRQVAARGNVQMVFQDPYASLNPRQTIGTAIGAGPLEQGMGRHAVRVLVLDLLEKVGLKADVADRYPHEFSGGQRQRVAIARALAMRPRLLVADEPVSALDVSVQAQVLELFDQVRREFALSMVFITHDLRVAAQMCDHIAVRRRGEIVEIGEARVVLECPAHAYTQELIAAAPTFHSTLESRLVAA